MDLEENINKNDDETDSDEFLTKKHIKNTLSIENDFNISKEDLYEEPKYYEDYDDFYFKRKSKKIKKEINSNNLDLSKKNGGGENLNIISITNENNNIIKEDNNKNCPLEECSISVIENNDKKENEVGINSYIYDDSMVSELQNNFSNINIQKKEEKNDLNIDINDDLLNTFEKAYPGLPSINDYKEIYKLIKEKNFDLSIFEIMNIIQREVSIKITECKSNNNNKFINKNNDNDIIDIDYDNEYNFPVEFIDIIDPIYINNEHLNIMKCYKTIPIKEKDFYFEAKDLTEDFFYDNENNEKRRKIEKFLDGSYNYIPILCKNKKCGNNNCIYSHNNNEINYHPLLYKTKYEDKQEYCETNIALCPTAKNFDTDFRIIYNYKDENIIQLMNILDSDFNTKKRIKSYYKKIKKFDINTFKIFKCKKEKCDKDTHLCYYYHDSSEKRRPPYLYRYTNQWCRDLKKGEKKCKKGDFCSKCHISNELKYHQLYFRKYILCRRDTKNGQCIYFDTCYGYHDEKNIETIKKKSAEYEKLKKEKKNVDDFKCQNCKKITKSMVFYYLKCKHILCKKCFNKNKSDNICPICEKEFKSGEEIIIDFKEAAKNIDELLSKK